jgi:hypothetical protein
MRDGFFGHEGLITKVSKSRIYYKPLRNGEVDETCRELYCSVFSAVCDTIEEVERLRSFSKSCVEEVMDLKCKHRKARDKFFESSHALHRSGLKHEDNGSKHSDSW